MRELTSEELVQYNELQPRINDRLMTHEEFSNWLDNSYVNPRIQEIEDELQVIQQWFKDNDWKPHKIIRGEWTSTSPQWLEYITECENKRTLQDTLNEELNTL